MIPLFKELWHDLMWSPERLRLWARGAVFTLGQVGSIMAANSDLPIPSSWAPWISALSGLALLIKAGDKNPK